MHWFPWTALRHFYYPIEKHPPPSSAQFWDGTPSGHVNVFWRLPACAYCLPPLWHFEVGRIWGGQFLHRKFPQNSKDDLTFLRVFGGWQKNTSNMIGCDFFQTPNRLLFGELDNRGSAEAIKPTHLWKVLITAGICPTLWHQPITPSNRQAWVSTAFCMSGNPSLESSTSVFHIFEWAFRRSRNSRSRLLVNMRQALVAVAVFVVLSDRPFSFLDGANVFLVMNPFISHHLRVDWQRPEILWQRLSKRIVMQQYSHSWAWGSDPAHQTEGFFLKAPLLTGLTGGPFSYHFVPLGLVT